MSITAITPNTDYPSVRNPLPTLQSPPMPPSPPAGNANADNTGIGSTDTTASAAPTPPAARSSADLFSKLAPKPHPATAQNSPTAPDYTQRVEQGAAGQGIEQNSPKAVRQGKEISAEVQALNSQMAGSVNVNLSSAAAVEEARSRIAAAQAEQQQRRTASNPQVQALNTGASPVTTVNTVVADSVNHALANPQAAYSVPQNYATALPRGNAVNLRG